MPFSASLPARAIARAGLSLCALTLLLALPAAASPAGEPRGVPWRSNFDQAWSEARARNRPLWVQFTGPWCIYCRKMDREVFGEPAVIAPGLGELVPVKVRSDEREDLIAHYGIGGLPATILIAPDGAILARHEGFLPTNDFLALLAPARRVAAKAIEAELLALQGYCPVSLVQGKGLVAGRRELAAQHDGRLYRFADAEARAAFLKDPEKYLPADGGRCLVSRLDGKKTTAGDPRFGVYYRDRLYLCADETAREAFAKEPERFAAVEIADEGNCPHCRQLAGKKVPGQTQFAATHGGRRYLFPDDEHRAAFREAPERYLR